MWRLPLLAALAFALTSLCIVPPVMAGPCKLMRDMQRSELAGEGALGGFGVTTTTYLTLPTSPFCITEKLFARNDAALREFVADNADHIATDVARGGGAWSASLAALLECPDTLGGHFAATLRKDLPELLAAPAEVSLPYERVLALAEADARLARACSFLATKNGDPLETGDPS